MRRLPTAEASAASNAPRLQSVLFAEDRIDGGVARLDGAADAATDADNDGLRALRVDLLDRLRGGPAVRPSAT